MTAPSTPTAIPISKNSPTRTQTEEPKPTSRTLTRPWSSSTAPRPLPRYAPHHPLRPPTTYATPHHRPRPNRLRHHNLSNRNLHHEKSNRHPQHRRPQRIPIP